MNGKLEVPRFATEAEAQWWFDHREETADLLVQAVAEERTTGLAAMLEKNRQRG